MPSLIRDRRVVVAAFAVVVAIAVAGGFWLLSRDGGSEQVSNGLTSYEFEARLEVETDRNETDHLLDTIRGWYAGNDRWRWEFSSSDPARVEDGFSQVSDGKSVWWYDRPTNKYYRQDLEEYRASQPPELGEGPTLLFSGLLIGPLPPIVAEALAGSDPIGREEVAGRPARILKAPVADPASESTTTLWLDEEFPFVLKFFATDAAGSHTARAEPVSLSFNERLKGDLFRFKAPPGAKEVEAPSADPFLAMGVFSSTNVQTGPSRTLSVPPGFLRPGYVPAGFRPSETHSSGGLSDTTFVRLRFETGAGRYLVLEQQMRAGGLAESHKQGRQVDVDGGDGYESNAGAERRLIWAKGDMVLKLWSNDLPQQELVRIAESVR
jgi:outer membrane lipoprotein-sorting protein